MAGNNGKSKVANTVVRDAENFREFYSQVQSWSFSDSDAVVSFMRYSPTIPGGKTGTLHDPNIKSFVREAVVYLTLEQAESLANGLLEGVKTSRNAAKK